jgi:hypothetical protein
VIQTYPSENIFCISILILLPLSELDFQKGEKEL